MSQFAEENPEEELVPGASGCLLALVVIAMFACYGLGILTGGYGQLYLLKRAGGDEANKVFPNPGNAPDAPVAGAPEEPPLAQPISMEHSGARITIDLATARFTRGGGSIEVKLTGILLVRLKLKNLSPNKPMEFSSWMHSDIRTWPAQLVDNQNQNYESIYDADERVGVYLMSLPHYRPTQTIPPGGEATTWIAFSIEKIPVAALRLSLPAVNYGGEGLVHFDIPAGVIGEGNPID